ncbi:MAG: hypothetical protein WBX11_12490 [Thiobacillaceae bacterium]
MKLQPLFVVLPVILAACAVQKTSNKAEPGTQITEAVESPFADLNLVRTAIPAVLTEARKNPYLPPKDLTCATLSAEVKPLDDALGPDLDVPQSSANPGLLERGAAEAGDAAIGALKGAAEGLLPYRSWVRKLTGAERHSKEVAAAIAAGGVRRAYLKGIGQTLGCQTPAAPAHHKAPD